MNVTVARRRMELARADAWLFFMFENATGPDAPCSEACQRQMRAWISKTRWKGRRNEVAVIPSPEKSGPSFILLAGLGLKKDFHPGRLEQAAASASKTARHYHLSTLAVSTEGLLEDPVLSQPNAARLVVRGLGLGFYEFTDFKSTEKTEKRRELSVFVSLTNSHELLSVRKAAEEARIVAETMNEVRDLANQPANEAFPLAIANKVRALARKYGLSFKLLDETALKKKGCKALLSVAKGSHHAPCVIQLTHPGTATRRAPVALVGKTMTFDSGGISLKTSKGMEWMKFDKSGGMAVLAAALIASRLKWPQPITGMLAVAENMPGGHASRPGDIVKSRAGKTIEILNTDAEGRLVLADALSLASDLKPRAIIDLATLTGAVIIALGHCASAIMSNNPELARQLEDAGAACGDRLWPLPLWQDYEDDIQGQFADLKNIGDGSAGTIIGGVFLKQFIPPEIPWAHVDIAGSAWLESSKPYGVPGATLAGTRLLIEWLQRQEPEFSKRK